MPRQLSFPEALHEATTICLTDDSAVVVFGLGVPDPKGIFGTTRGLAEQFGEQRVFDMPTSENGMTGVAIGAALAGSRPIMIHQRFDFALLSVDQIVNQAAKWNYLFAGETPIPLVIRLIVGRGWGQGPQHSQSLHSWFAHVPGLKVVLPATPADAKGLLIASVEDDNPVLFIEHRWLYPLHGDVPEGRYVERLGEASRRREGADVTVASISYMTVEAVRAADYLADYGVDVEVIDVRTVSPLDSQTITESVRKTNRLVVADIGWTSFGVGAEIVSRVTEHAFDSLKAPPCRIGLPDCPTPTAASIANVLYPQYADLVAAVCRLVGREDIPRPPMGASPADIPDPSFTGPF